MTKLEDAIISAYQHDGASEYANKVYAVLFRTMLFMPVELQDDEEEPFTPWIFTWNEHFLIPAFTTLDQLQTWAKTQDSMPDYVTITGADLVRGVATDNVYLCLNPNTESYKEFAPDEVERLKSMLTKIDQLKNAANAINDEF